MNIVTVETSIHQSIEKVWKLWTSPDHIINWNFATPQWHCPSAELELKVGGKLKYHMAAKDGSMAFDYIGIITSIAKNSLLEYTLEDGRKVSIRFTEENGISKVTESFEVEDENSIDMQRQGWQAILENFKNYAESQ